MTPSDENAAVRSLLRDAVQSVEQDDRARGIFQDRFGFGRSPAVVVIDFAYGRTDHAYAGGSRRLDGPVAATGRLLAAARAGAVPVVYTTSPWRPGGGDPPFKSAADPSPGFRAWDERACRIDERVEPWVGDLILEKENASAFFETHLAPHMIAHRVDTLLLTGCSTSACVRAAATDAKSDRLRPVVVRECVGDRSAVAHEWTLFDVQARFADVVPLD